MPHIVLEYTKNITTLNPAATLLRLNQAVIASGEVQNPNAIKSRAVRLDDFLVGTSNEGNAYIHIRMSLLEGRSPEVKKKLSQSLLDALREVVVPSATLKIQVNVEVNDIVKDVFSRDDFVSK